MRRGSAADSAVEATYQRRQEDGDAGAVERYAASVSKPCAVLCDDATSNDVVGGAFEEASHVI